jgi:hypothetical protein
MRRMRARAACLAVACLAGILPDAGAQPAATATCPQKIEVEQRIASIPAGWEGGHATATVALASVTFFDGPPAEKAARKFDGEDRQKRDRVATWNLPPSARGYWISCGYAGTTAVISRRLPDSVRSCAVTYERRRPGPGAQPAVKRIDCK